MTDTYYGARSQARLIAETELIRDYLDRERVYAGTFTFRVAISMADAEEAAGQFLRRLARELCSHLRVVWVVERQPNGGRPHGHFVIVELLTVPTWMLDEVGTIASIKRAFRAACPTSAGSIVVKPAHHNSLRYVAEHEGTARFETYCSRIGPCRHRHGPCPVV